MEQNSTETVVTAEAPKSQPTAPNTTNGLAIAALIVGIVAFLGGLVPFWGFVLGAAAVVLGIIGLKKAGGKGLSITGIITGGLAVLANSIATIVFIVALAASGAAVNTITEAANEQTAEAQSLIDGKKDFKKGETANFAGKYEVKVNSVQRNYVPSESYYTPAAGKEYVVVNVTVKNLSDETEYSMSSDFSLNEAGVSVSASYITIDGEFGSGELSSGASKTGNLLYEVTKDASDLKLQFTSTVLSPSYEAKKLTYTLAI